MLGINWDVVDWGDAPTWLGATFAAIAGVVAYRLWRTESDRDEVAAMRDRQDQASRICAWYGLNAEGKRYFAHVLNGSGPPVYDVTLQFFQLPLFYEPDVELPVLDQVPLGVLPPGEVLVPLTEFLAQGLPADEFTAGITFRDSSNNYWRRLPSGILREAAVGQPPAPGALPRAPLKVRLRRALREAASRRAA